MKNPLQGEHGLWAWSGQGARGLTIALHQAIPMLKRSYH